MGDPDRVAGGAEGIRGPAGLDETADQIKGSTLLMAGRVVGVLANMVVQVLVVRHLSTGDYGAFAYALSFTTAARVVVTLGHARTITRFFAIYEERRQHDKLVGTIIMELGIISTVGAACILLTWGLQGWLAETVVPGELAARVLLIIVILVPVEALDEVMEGLFAVFARPMQVFVRRYVLTPALKLSVAAVLVWMDRGVVFLAIGYVVVSAVGLLFYVPALRRALIERGVLAHVSWRTARMPVREVFSFSIPLLSTDVVQISLNTASVAILGFFTGSAAVAAFGAIRPAATLNSFVTRSFALLFLPLVSRMHARSDADGIRDAYWRTAVWLAILTFPMFAMTSVFAEPMTVTLFGERYRESAAYLVILAVAYYVNAALGFNATVLQVLGRLRHLVVVNTTVAIANIALCLLLIPIHGAFGVAIAVGGALVLQNVMNQWGLRRAGIGVLPRQHVRVYASILVTAAVLWMLERVLEPGIVLSVALTGACSLVLFVGNRRVLRIADVYPGVAGVPLLRHLVGSPPDAVGPPPGVPERR